MGEHDLVLVGETKDLLYSDAKKAPSASSLATEATGARESFRTIHVQLIDQSVSKQSIVLTQMQRMALGGSHSIGDAARGSESEMDERERVFWEDIEEDFISR